MSGWSAGTFAICLLLACLGHCRHFSFFVKQHGRRLQRHLPATYLDAVSHADAVRAFVSAGAGCGSGVASYPGPACESGRGVFGDVMDVR